MGTGDVEDGTGVNVAQQTELARTDRGSTAAAVLVEVRPGRRVLGMQGRSR